MAIKLRSVRKAVLITVEQNEKLEKVSKEKELSQNEIINKALDAYLARFK
ncbi:MAG: hypothetical protein IIW92_02195 [Lachnospiraceae bacterium]|nr:hypothetical protein [Lachnospiraceae bacterium]